MFHSGFLWTFELLPMYDMDFHWIKTIDIKAFFSKRLNIAKEDIVYACYCPEIWCSKAKSMVHKSHTEAVARRSFVKKVFLKISQNAQENTCVEVFYWNCRPEACNFIQKGLPTWVFSCEFCKVFKSTFLYRTTPIAAS